MVPSIVRLYCTQSTFRAQASLSLSYTVIYSSFIVDIEKIASSVENELLLVAEKRERERQESLRKSNLVALTAQYQKFRSQEPAMVLPPFSTFLRLPMITSFLNFTEDKRKKSVSTSNAQDDTSCVRTLCDLLKQPEVQIVLRSELSKWEASVRQRFAERLGLPRWVSASATVLHPLDRLTARFRCKKCDSVSNCYKMDSCLDFVGVCRHVCKTADENDDSEMGDSWDASRFDRDERVSSNLLP